MNCMKRYYGISLMGCFLDHRSSATASAKRRTHEPFLFFQIYVIHNNIDEFMQNQTQDKKVNPDFVSAICNLIYQKDLNDI